MNRQSVYSPGFSTDKKFGIGSPADLSPIAYRAPRGYSGRTNDLSPANQYNPYDYGTGKDSGLNPATGRPSSVGNYENYITSRNRIRADTEARNVRRQETTATIDQASSGFLGILGSAAILEPELLPVLAGAGIGYGIYKIGNSFDLW